MPIAERSASAAWEPVPFADGPGHFIWAWFKPPAAPSGLFVRIPEDGLRGSPDRQRLTLRELLRALAVDPCRIAMWSLYGVPYDGQQGGNPALDFPIPVAPADVDPTIAIYLAEPSSPAAAPVGGQPQTAAHASVDMFSRIDAAWSASLQLELQLAGVAKQVSTMLTRLNSLNRNLSPEEARFGDNQDKREWEDARRWLRDVATRLSRTLKDHHLGFTSAAGKRNAYEALHRQYIVPRLPFEGLAQADRDFESYRKIMQTLLNNMNAAQSAAAQDGERRAQLILNRIAAKVRGSRSKR